MTSPLPDGRVPMDVLLDEKDEEFLAEWDAADAEALAATQALLDRVRDRAAAAGGPAPGGRAAAPGPRPAGLAWTAADRVQRPAPEEPARRRHRAVAQPGRGRGVPPGPGRLGPAGLGRRRS